MFGSILGLCAIQHLGPRPPGSVWSGLILMTWISGCTSHWLATPTVSVSPLIPAHPISQTDCRSKFMWLVVLPSHRRWPVQAMYPFLLGALTGVIFMDFWDIILLHQLNLILLVNKMFSQIYWGKLTNKNCSVIRCTVWCGVCTLRSDH